MTWLSNRKIGFPDTDVFKTIFNDHREDFKEVHPKYDTDQYETPVQKMLGCRDASLSGFMKCGAECLEDVVSSVKRKKLKIEVLLWFRLMVDQGDTIRIYTL